MKKSEILKVLNEESENNVKEYYRISDSNLLVVYVEEINWKHLKIIGERILDITGTERRRDEIRICFNKVEFD